MKTNDTAGAKWTQGQVLTLVLLVLGYTGYYFCRANFSVAKPSIIDDLVSQGMTKDAAKQALGVIATWGTLSYAFGKFIAGAIGDTGHFQHLIGRIKRELRGRHAHAVLQDALQARDRHHLSAQKAVGIRHRHGCKARGRIVEIGIQDHRSPIGKDRAL